MVSVRRRWLFLAALALSVAVAGSPTVAQASFPGVNGKIAFHRTYDTPTEPTCIVVANANGTGETNPLGCDADAEAMPRWNPTGGQLAYRGFAGQLDLVNSDGTNQREFFFDPGAWTTGHTWSPDGTELAVSWYDCFDNGTCGGRLEKVNGTTGAATNIVSTTDFVSTPDWSPDGTKIAFTRAFQIWTVLANGTNQVQVAPGSPGENHSPSWSPSGSKIAFVSTRDENEEIYVMNANGTNPVRLTDNTSIDTTPRWSPDGTKIIFESDRDNGDHEIYVMNADGSGQTRVTNNTGFDTAPDWAPITVGYVRPQTAVSVRFPLVPAFNQCTSGNRTHGPPLVHPSCNPPVRSSSQLTIGSPDSNGKGANFSGFIKYKVVPGNTGTPADEADVTINMQISDVYRVSGLTDYTGEVNARSFVRITDRNNTPNPGGPGPGTLFDHPISVTAPCTTTADPNVGGSCGITTTVDTLVPGTVVEAKRTVWNMGTLQVEDGGPDNDGDTLGDNTIFLKQGVFIP